MKLQGVAAGALLPRLQRFTAVGHSCAPTTPLLWCAAVWSAAWLRQLRSLQLGRVVIGSTTAVPLHSLELPQLESLCLRLTPGGAAAGVWAALASAAMPALRRLELGRAGASDLEQLLAAPWAGGLEELLVDAIYIGGREPQMQVAAGLGDAADDGGADGIAAPQAPRLSPAMLALTDAPLPRLRALRLTEAGLRPADAAALACAPWATALTCLSLANSPLLDLGVACLAAGPFHSLRALNIDYTFCGPRGLALLAAAPCLQACALCTLRSGLSTNPSGTHARRWRRRSRSWRAPWPAAPRSSTAGGRARAAWRARAGSCEGDTWLRAKWVLPCLYLQLMHPHALRLTYTSIARTRVGLERHAGFCTVAG